MNINSLVRYVGGELIKKIISILILLFSLCVFASAEEVVTVYNKNEMVALSHEVVTYNAQYYLHLDDLLHLGLSVENNGGTYTISANDVLGRQSYVVLTPWAIGSGIVVRPISANIVEDSASSKIEEVLCYENFYRRATKTIGTKPQSLGTGDVIYSYENTGAFIGNEAIMVCKNDEYYLSAKLIGEKLSYQYSISDGRIDFDIADNSCVRFNATIYLAQNIVASTDGYSVPVSVGYKTGTGENLDDFTVISSTSCEIEENYSGKCQLEIPANKITGSKMYFLADLGGRHASVCYECDFSKIGYFVVYGEQKDITYTLDVSLPETDEVDVPFTVYVEAGESSYSKQGVIPKGEQSTTLNVEGLPITRKYSTRIEFGYHKYKNAYLEDINFYQPRDFSTDYTAEYSNKTICNVSLPEGYHSENDVIVTVKLSQYLPVGSVVTKDQFLNWEDTKTVVLNQENPSQQIVLYTQIVAMLSYTIQDAPEDLCQKGYFGLSGKIFSDKEFIGKIDEDLTIDLKLLQEKVVTVAVCRPFSLPDDTDIFATVELYDISTSTSKKYILNQPNTPLIPAGEYITKVYFRVPEDKYYLLKITDISGDDHVFGYYNYSYGSSVAEGNVRTIGFSADKVEVVLSRCNIVTGRVESDFPDLSCSVLATCHLYDGKTIYLPASVENGMFSLKIPEDTDYYVLDVQTDVGVKSYYISDGISTNEEDDATKIYYEYNEDKEVVIQYFVQNPALPIILSSNIKGNEIELVHVSDYPLEAFDVYIAYHNRDGTLNSVGKIEDVILQGGRRKTYPISVNDYRIQTAKVFAWKNDSMTPVSHTLEIPINQPALMEQDLFVFTAGETNAVINCKNETLFSAPREINDTLYLSAVDFERLGYQITEKRYQVYIGDEWETYQFTVGEYVAVLDEYNIQYELSAPILQEEDELWIPVAVVLELFGKDATWSPYDHILILNMPFSDVEYASVYREAIFSMYYNGVVMGYEDGTFRPTNTLMRSEASAIFCRVMGYSYSGFSFSCSDVATTYWAKSWIGICVNEGFFKLENDSFRPEECITVEEAVEAALNMVGEPYENSIETANQIGLMTHINNENTSRSITRAELMQLLYNAKKV